MKKHLGYYRFYTVIQSSKIMTEGDIEKYGTGFHRIRTAIKDYPETRFNYKEAQDGFMSELNPKRPLDFFSNERH